MIFFILQLIKLLGDQPVKIQRDVFTSAVRLAKKSAKPAYTLTMKLMPGLFSTEEMAQPRGQGLVGKKGDMRPVLSKEKISTLKVSFFKHINDYMQTNIA